MFNPYILLAIIIGWGASIAGAGIWSYNAGKDAVTAQEAREDKLVQKTTDAAMQAAASAIAGIEIKNTTIRQATERIVREQKIFTECRSGPELVRLLNSLPAVAASGPVAAGGGELPASSPTR